MHLDNPSDEPESASMDDTLPSARSVEVSSDEPTPADSAVSSRESIDIPPFPTRRESGDSDLWQTGDRQTGDLTEDDESAQDQDESPQDKDTSASPRVSEGLRSGGVIHEGFLSSLRHPKDLRDFNRIVPNGAERLLQLTEEEALHRHEMERLQVEGQIALERAQLNHQNEANLEVVRGHIARIRGENNVRIATGCGAHAASILSICLAGYLGLQGHTEVAKAVIYAVAAIYISAVLAGSFRNERRPRKRTLPEWPPDIYDEKDEDET